MSENLSRNWDVSLGKTGQLVVTARAITRASIYIYKSERDDRTALTCVIERVRVHARGMLMAGMCTGNTRWQGARVAYWTLALFSPIKSQKTLHQRAQLSVKHGTTAAANSISRRIGSRKCRRSSKFALQMEDREIREGRASLAINNDRIASKLLVRVNWSPPILPGRPAPRLTA